MKIDLSMKVEVSSGLLDSSVDDETILLDLQSENYFGFDAVASDIWRLLKEGTSLQKTYEILLGIYEVEPEELRKDLFEFVEKLEENGLVKVV